MTASGRLTWREPDGLRCTLDRYDRDRWCVTVLRATGPGATAAVRDTRDGAVACVTEVLAVAREGKR